MSKEITLTEFNERLTEMYNMLCRSAMNQEYYGIALNSTQRANDILEILIALGTTGSGIFALAIWLKEPFGPWIWGIITAISAFLAVAKPIIQLNRKIERLTRLYVGHSDNYANIVIMLSRIRQYRKMTPDLLNVFKTSEARFLELSKDDDPRPNSRRLQYCEDIVRKRHPPESAWYLEPSSGPVQHA